MNNHYIEKILNKKLKETGIGWCSIIDKITKDT